MEDTEDTREYQVVVNHEEQYSIWLSNREPPSGWRTVGTKGTKQQCLEYIKSVWTDLRPLSLRQALHSSSSQKS